MRFNNWTLKQDPDDPLEVCLLGEKCSVGDEIESESTGQYGVVLGVIRNRFNEPVCYKVWYSPVDPDEAACFDYIPADKVTCVERCEEPGWSLQRCGYRLIETVDGEYYYNDLTEDAVLW